MKITNFSLIMVAMVLIYMMAQPVSAQEKLQNDSVALVNANSSSEPSLRVSIPASPQALAFQRVGEFDVNNSSGIPDINIPLFEIDHFGYKIPMSLRYEPLPFKAGYHYDVYGYGWTLQGNSCVSRTINSQPDESFDFKLSKDFMNKYIGNAAYSLNSNNWEYDNFSVVLPDGSNFDFVIQNLGNGAYGYKVSNGRSVKITFQRRLESFVIIDEDGVKYTFDVIDYTRGVSRPVTWNLSRIDLPYSDIPILLTYETILNTNYAQVLDTPYLYLYHNHKYAGNYAGELPDETIMKHGKVAGTASKYDMKLLTGIWYGPTHIALDYVYGSNQHGYNHLKRITVKDNAVVKRYFDLSYQKETVMSFQDSVALLKSLTIHGVEASQTPMVYTFKYSTVSRMNGADYWGNLTNQFVNFTIANMNAFVENGISWLPTNGYPAYRIKEKDAAEAGNPYTKICLQENNHAVDHCSPSSPYSHGVLVEMTYPTGGKTKFEYENHKFVTAHDSDGKYIHTKKKRRIYEGGGFRIRKISNYTADGKIADVMSYCYGPTYRQIKDEKLNLPCKYNTSFLDTHCGFGEPVVDPNILTFCSFTAYQEPTKIQYMLTGLSKEGRQEAFPDPFFTFDPHETNLPTENWRWECTFSALNFRSLLNGRKAVVYPYITVYDGDVWSDESKIGQCSGMTTYKYYVYDDERYQDSTYFEAPRYFGKVLASEEKKYKWNQLLEKTEYELTDGEFKVKNRETYRYSEFENYVEGYVDAQRQPVDTYDFYHTIREMMAEKGNYYGYSKLSDLSQECYLPNGMLLNNETYAYNANLILNSIKKGEKETTISYPIAKGGSVPIVQKMLERNMLKTPLQTIVAEYGNDSSGEKVEYKEYCVGNKNVILPSEVSALCASPLNDSTYFVSMDSVISYTLNGHLRKIITKDGVHTVYLWGYNNRYLIAEIVNATLSEVTNAVQTLLGMDIESLESSDAFDEKKWILLGQQPSLSKAMVTSFTYCPLVGITSQTVPSGRTVYYRYDGLGSLIEEYDYKNNIVADENHRTLKQYECHYSNVLK